MLRRREQLMSACQGGLPGPRRGADDRQHLLGADRLPGDARTAGRRGPFPHHLRPRLPGARTAPGLGGHPQGRRPWFEARVVDRVETLYLLVDRHIVLLNLTVPGSESPGSHAESLLMRHAGLGQTLHDAFERTWEQGVPWSRPSWRTAHPPSWAQRPARAAPPHPGGAVARQQRPLGPITAEPARPAGRRGNSLGPGAQYTAVRPNWRSPRDQPGMVPCVSLGSFGESSPQTPPRAGPLYDARVEGIRRPWEPVPVRAVGGRLGGAGCGPSRGATRGRPVTGSGRRCSGCWGSGSRERGCSTCSPGGALAIEALSRGPPRRCWSSRRPRR